MRDETLLVCQLPQAGEIPGLGLENPDVLENRFGDQGSHRIAVADIADRVKVVEVDDVYQLLVGNGSTGSQGDVSIFPRGNPGTNLIEWCQDIAAHIIIRTIESTLHDDHVVPFGRGPSKPDRSSSRLRSGVAELDALDGWNMRAQ